MEASSSGAPLFKVKAVATEEEKALQDKYAALRKKKARARCGSRR
jgi:hypothetical protein